MSLHSIRPRHLPEKELQVDDAELLDLTRLGFVVDTRATTDDGLRRAAESASEQAAAEAAEAAETTPRRAARPRKSTGKPGQSSEPETSDSASTDDSKEG